MKRRLSVAIACIGDPKIIYLDEPTTGMLYIVTNTLQARRVSDKDGSRHVVTCNEIYIMVDTLQYYIYIILYYIPKIIYLDEPTTGILYVIYSDYIGKEGQ